jgi:predicted aldo/keto reductase-like oxidoreductase
MGSKIPWEVSALGFGCMRLPAKKFLFFFKKIDEPEAIKILRYGIDHGINYIDTAFMYMSGQSEIVVGKALQDGYREKVHLVTKLPMGKVKSREDFDKLLNEQLTKLQTDHLDIYLFHALNGKLLKTIRDLNLIEKMEQAKADGKIMHFGFSFHDNYDAFKEIIDYYNWDCCQIQYNYMDTENQATTKGLEYAASKGIAVIIMEPLRGGKLANPSPEIIQLMDQSSIKRTPVDWALQFLWNRKEVSVVLSGMGALQQVKENLESADKSSIGLLTPQENKTLEQVSELYKNLIIIPCTKCQYCMPCTVGGVNIPEVFDIVNEYGRDKNLKRATMRYKKLIHDANKVNKENPNGGPEVCTKCGACAKKCPQQIDIPAMLAKVKQFIAGGALFEQVFPKK